MHFLLWCHTFDIFVASCDVLQSWNAHSFSADESSNSFCVFADVDHLALRHYDGVHICIHFSIDKRDIIRHISALTPYGFDWSWATAIHPYVAKRKKVIVFFFVLFFKIKEYLKKLKIQQSSHTFTPFLWCWVKNLPAIHIGSQILASHPALHPHMKVPVRRSPKWIIVIMVTYLCFLWIRYWSLLTICCLCWGSASALFHCRPPQSPGSHWRHGQSYSLWWHDKECPGLSWLKAESKTEMNKICKQLRSDKLCVRLLKKF